MKTNVQHGWTGNEWMPVHSVRYGARSSPHKNCFKSHFPNENPKFRAKTAPELNLFFAFLDKNQNQIACFMSHCNFNKIFHFHRLLFLRVDFHWNNEPQKKMNQQKYQVHFWLRLNRWAVCVCVCKRLSCMKIEWNVWFIVYILKKSIVLFHSFLCLHVPFYSSPSFVSFFATSFGWHS